MKFSGSKWRAVVGIVLLMVAWVGWSHLSVLGPRILCIEDSGSVRLEIADTGSCAPSTGCCEAPAPAEDEDDCGDCEDLTYELVVTNTRFELEHFDNTDFDSFEHLVALPATTVIAKHNRGLLHTSIRSPRHVCDPMHVLPGAVPLIC